ncbi:hypothetical protein ABBQ38_011144 [Trebouxia sp. C0009 RCD-2024]
MLVPFGVFYRPRVCENCGSCRVYAPLSVPLGSQLNFVWSGKRALQVKAPNLSLGELLNLPSHLLPARAHGVYLIPTNQCPDAFPPGPNELYPVSAHGSVNNMLSVRLTSPGVFYFACQVGDHCINDGQKQVVTVTNSTAGTSTTNSTVGTVNDLAVLSPTG